MMREVPMNVHSSPSGAQGGEPCSHIRPPRRVCLTFRESRAVSRKVGGHTDGDNDVALPRPNYFYTHHEGFKLRFL